MRILIHTGTRDCLNLGDVAMLQATCRRLRELWTDVELMVLTDAPERLAAVCPGSIPIPAGGLFPWVAERFLIGRAHRWLPARWSEAAVAAKRSVGRRWPGVLDAAVDFKLRVQRTDRESVTAFRDAFGAADCIVVCGQGSLTDGARSEAGEICLLLNMAAARRKPAVLFGQGIGPLRDPELRREAQRALRTARLIALREQRVGPGVLADLGLGRDRILVTGDDAVEAAFEAKPPHTGAAIGLNLRLSRNSGLSPEHLPAFGSAIRRACESVSATVLPVPISIHENGTNDAFVLDRFFESSGWDGREIHDLRTPAAVIRQVGRCRVMITAAYHAAVFALAQGIPTICVANCDFFEDKFLGLAGLFGPGCEVLSVSSPNFPERLCSTVFQHWEQADEFRTNLLDRAALQIRWARGAYERAAGLLAGRASMTARA
ncbi:MAG TPA: polysaccharide pyruvyl transferase family protein [Bryobacteraceae bacterium]|nr:polysaccharide pyruvyl transferase family protein [Bryobacteraceae bacterium]